MLAPSQSSESYIDILYDNIMAYHEDPCGSQGPKHTQQKSDLQDWFLHTMWLQPPSFSIVAPRKGIKEQLVVCFLK